MPAPGRGPGAAPGTTDQFEERTSQHPRAHDVPATSPSDCRPRKHGPHPRRIHRRPAGPHRHRRGGAGAGAVEAAGQGIRGALPVPRRTLGFVHRLADQAVLPLLRLRRARHRDLVPDELRPPRVPRRGRSEEHTSELQSLMRISYAVFCLKKKKTHNQNNKSYNSTQYTTTNNINRTRTKLYNSNYKTRYIDT